LGVGTSGGVVFIGVGSPRLTICHTEKAMNDFAGRFAIFRPLR
jgi:hypothetical protein